MNFLSQCRNLWLAVILQAFLDLQLNSKKKPFKDYKARADLWINYKKDFLEVCKFANIDPIIVIDLKHKFKKLENFNNKIILKHIFIK